MQRERNSLRVVCAIIRNSANEILACQRSSNTSLAGKWEFPGGKIEHGETNEQAIIREIQEELGVGINILYDLPLVSHQYPEFHISLFPYLCTIKEGHSPSALEHASIQWISPVLATSLDWAEADRLILSDLIQNSDSFMKE